MKYDEIPESIRDEFTKMKAHVLTRRYAFDTHDLPEARKGNFKLFTHNLKPPEHPI